MRRELSLEIAFRLTPDGKETILHNFTAGADGAEPRDALIMDSAGNLYGTTYGGAPRHVRLTCGVVSESDEKGNETVLHPLTARTAHGRRPASSAMPPATSTGRHRKSAPITTASLSR